MNLRSLSNLNELDLLKKGVDPEKIFALREELTGLRENLAKLQEYQKQNRIEYLKPNPPQAKFLEALLHPRYKVLAAVGSNKFGKTAIGVISALSMLFGKYLWTDPPAKIPFPHKEPRMVRYMAQDFKDHAKTVVVPEIRKWWPKNRPLITRNDPVSGVPAFFTDVKTGSVLQIMSAKQEPSAHAGWDGDAYICDEPFRREVYNEIVPRFLVRNGRILLCMTILDEHVWIDRDIIKAVDEDGLPKTNIFVVHGNVYDNVGPDFGIKTEEQVEEVMALFGDDEVTIQCRKWGIPTYLSGLIQPQFSRQTHLVPRFPVPIDWPIDIIIDTHPRKKQAVTFGASDDKDQKWLVDEIHEHAGPEDLGHMIGKLCWRRGYRRITNCIVDPLAKGIGMGARKFDDTPETITYFSILQETLWAYGIYLRTSGKEKAAYKSGIKIINRFLMGPNKLPSLFFFSDLKQAVKSIESWSYVKDSEEPGEDGKDFGVNLCWLILLNTRWSPMRPRKRDQMRGESWMAV